MIFAKHPAQEEIVDLFEIDILKEFSKNKDASRLDLAYTMFKMGFYYAQQHYREYPIFTTTENENHEQLQLF